jgi:Fe2+ transport system protein FeoA
MSNKAFFLCFTFNNDSSPCEEIKVVTCEANGDISNMLWEFGFDEQLELNTLHGDNTHDYDVIDIVAGDAGSHVSIFCNNEDGSQSLVKKYIFIGYDIKLVL